MLEHAFSAEAIQQRVAELGAAIQRDYAGRDLLLVGVLKGVLYFLADLARAIPRPDVEIDCLAISSYGPSAPDDGVVRIVKDLDGPITGRHVLLVEDIIDTGLTLRYVLQNLQARRPASLNVCVLLDRPTRRLAEIPIVYTGFSTDANFLVGYGLDYRGLYRNRPDIRPLSAVESRLREPAGVA